ncbi:putative salicylate hydroxylase [Xylogone sp. PMI_703]|nr:putative salicylate hydroxylase [Xylogone sp. PMI_703]
MSTSSVNGIEQANEQDVEAIPASRLKVVIVGGGIGGFTAAIALRRQGHIVNVYEQSRFASEIGAAIHLVPNAVGVLRRLGVGPEEGSVLLKQTRYFDQSGKLLATKDNLKTAGKWENKWYMAHRVNLHNHLKTVATAPEGEGIPVQVHTSSKVDKVDPHLGTVVLCDGTCVYGDLIVGADGVHSATRSAITGKQFRSYKSHENAIRFLISRESALADPITRDLVTEDGSMDMWYGSNRKIVIYPCVNSTLLNFVCIHPSHLSGSSDEYNEPVSQQKLLEIYRDFDPRMVHLLKKSAAESLKVFPLYDMETLPTFINDKLAVIGDAAHPFTPHLAQGGAMAIEDAVSLGVMLPLGTKPEEISERLKLYNEARYKRATTVQNNSRIAGGDGTASAQTLDEFWDYAMSHDEYHASTQILREYTWNLKPNIRWRQPVVFGPLPGPRQDFEGHSRTLTLASSSTITSTIHFNTSATLLRNLFPNRSYSFARPDSVVIASFSIQTLKDMDWLGGGSYDLCALYIHGVQYTKQDGKILRGSYCPIMFENLTDPILSGREELGFPKLYSDIQIVETNSSSRHVKISWRGTEWATFDWHDTDVPGTFVHKCIPVTGGKYAAGKRAEVEYDVFIPPPPETGVGPISKKWGLKSDHAGFKINDLGAKKLPTLHHIVSRLAEIPIFDIIYAGISEEQGVTDLTEVEKIE